MILKTTLHKLTGMSSPQFVGIELWVLRWWTSNSIYHSFYPIWKILDFRNNCFPNYMLAFFVERESIRARSLKSPISQIEILISLGEGMLLRMVFRSILTMFSNSSYKSKVISGLSIWNKSCKWLTNSSLMRFMSQDSCPLDSLKEGMKFDILWIIVKAWKKFIFSISIIHS